MERQRGRVRRQRDAFDLLELSRIEHRNRPLARVVSSSGRGRPARSCGRCEFGSLRVFTRRPQVIVSVSISTSVSSPRFATNSVRSSLDSACAFGARAGHHRARRDRRVARMECVTVFDSRCTPYARLASRVSVTRCVFTPPDGTGSARAVGSARRTRAACRAPRSSRTAGRRGRSPSRAAGSTAQVGMRVCVRSTRSISAIR